MMRGLRQLRGCVGRVAPRARRARAAKRRRARGRGLLSLRTQGRTPLRARLRCRGLCVCFFGSVFVLGLVRARCPALAPDRDGGIAVGMKRKMPRVLPARGAPVVFVPVARRLNVLVCAVRAAARLCFSCPVGAAPRARRLGVSRGASGRTSSRPTTSPPTSRRASSWAAGARPSASSRATCVGVVGGGGGAFGCFGPPASPPPKQEGSSRARGSRRRSTGRGVVVARRSEVTLVVWRSTPARRRAAVCRGWPSRARRCSRCPFRRAGRFTSSESRSSPKRIEPSRRARLAARRCSRPPARSCARCGRPETESSPPPRDAAVPTLGRLPTRQDEGVPFLTREPTGITAARCKMMTGVAAEIRPERAKARARALAEGRGIGASPDSPLGRGCSLSLFFWGRAVCWRFCCCSWCFLFCEWFCCGGPLLPRTQAGRRRGAGRHPPPFCSALLL